MRIPAIKETFGRWFSSGIEQKSGLTNPDPWLFEAFGASPTLSGPAITPQAAMKVPAVSAAVSLISTTIGSLPAKVFGRDDKGGKSSDPTHPAYALVHDDASEWLSSTALRTQLTSDSLLHGNGYAFANRVEGRVVELIPLSPQAVTIEFEAREPRFVVREGSGKRTLHHRDVLHIPAFGGAAPIYLAREAIALALVLEQHAARLFANGARPSGIVSFTGNMPAEALTKAKAAWQAAHGGSKTGGTAVMDNGAKFQQLVLNSVDAQFAEMRAFQIVEIARAFRVPPVLLMDYARATWSNSEEMGRQFLQFTLLPWLRTWEAAYRRVLLSPEERDIFSIEFVVDDLLRADTASRAAAYSQFRSMGVMTANDVRRRENLPAIEGGDELQNPFTTPGLKKAA